MKLNLKGQSGFQEQFALIPAGSYGVSVVTSKEGESKTGNPKLQLAFQVEEDEANGGKYVGRRIFADIPITAKTMGRVVDVLLALGYEKTELDDEAFELDPAELIGLTCTVAVVIRKLPGIDGLPPTEVNDIKRYHPAGHVTAGSVAAAPAIAWADEEVEDEAGDIVFDETDGDPAIEEEENLPEVTEEALEEAAATPESGATIPEDMQISAKAREFAEEHNLDLTDVTGSGPGGTVTLNDVRKLVG